MILKHIVKKEDLSMMACEKIRTIDDLEKFINDLANGIDNYKEERERIIKLLFEKNDGKSCERIIKFLKI